MRIFELNSEVQVARRTSDVFPFFSDADNLERLTPPWLRFQVVTPGPIRLKVGTCIEYRLRIRGVPIRWISEITAWEPPHRFVDRQVRGPYRLWIHEHRFRGLGEWRDLRGYGPVCRMGRRRGEPVGRRSGCEADLRLPAREAAGDLQSGCGTPRPDDLTGPGALLLSVAGRVFFMLLSWQWPSMFVFVWFEPGIESLGGAHGHHY